MEVIDTFELGFADRTLGLRLPDKRRREGQAIRDRLERIGLFRPSDHEHFTGSLTIPVLDVAGHVTELYGRRITAGLRPGTPLHLYLPAESRHAGRGVWNLAALQGSHEIILTEALIDALAFWCAGFRNVTASYGVEGFTQDHFEAFRRFGTRRALITYDRDEAGDQAAQKLAEKLMAQGIECFRIQFPKGMDANEYALKVHPASKSLGVVIRQALWLGSGKPTSISSASVTTPSKMIEAASPHAALAVQEELREVTPTPSETTLPASPVPTAASAEIACEVRENEVTFAFADRRYRVRGLSKNLAYELLKVNVLVSQGEAFHTSTPLICTPPRRAPPSSRKPPPSWD